MKNRIYSTIENAYKGAERAGAKSFGSDYYAYANRVDDILASAYKSATARTFAKWNLAKFEKTLCTLECTQNGAYKWSAIGHFDSDGLLYPMGEKAPDKVIKPRTRKPAKAKGNGIDFGKVVGKTKSARNKSAHKLILAMGAKVGTDEYKSLWEEWTKVR
jgi:hypothetical protein